MPWDPNEWGGGGRARRPRESTTGGESGWGWRVPSDSLQFLGLLLILLAANIPYWDRALWPDRDTVNVFQVFYTFYNNW